MAFRLVNARLAGAFDGWRSSAQRRKDQREMVTQSIKRMTAQKLAGAFYRWAEAVEEIKEMRVKVKRCRSTL